LKQSEQNAMPVGRISLGEKVRELRERTGWTKEELARKAGVHVKTVRRIEKSLPVMLTLIGYVAKALDVDCGDILTPNPPSESRPKPKSPYKRLELILGIKVKIESLAKAGQFAADFEEFLAAKYPTILFDIDAGSLLVSLEMEFEDIVSVLYSFCRGKFDKRRLREIIFPKIDIEDLRLALLAIHIRVVSDSLRRDSKLTMTSPYRLRSFATRLARRLGIRNIAALRDRTVLRELSELRANHSVRYIFNWLLRASSRRLLTHITMDQLRQTLMSMNVTVELLADGSVKVVRAQRRPSPLAAH
jgi:transcriptional regulator with XRE-family HTH domain